MSIFMYQVVCSLRVIKQAELLSQNFVENGLKQQTCYHEKIVNDDGALEDDLWFYGDLIDG